MDVRVGLWRRVSTEELTRWTLVSRVMSLLLNILSRLVTTFLPRSKRLLISWLQSPSVVILEPQKIKSNTVSTVSPSIFHEVMGPDKQLYIFDAYIWIFLTKVLSFHTLIKNVCKCQFYSIFTDTGIITEFEYFQT